MVGEPAVRRWPPILSLGRGDVRACVFGWKAHAFCLCFTTCLIWEAFARKELRRFFRWPLGGGPATASGAKIVVRARAHTHTHTHTLCALAVPTHQRNQNQL